MFRSIGSFNILPSGATGTSEQKGGGGGGEHVPPNYFLNYKELVCKCLAPPPPPPPHTQHPNIESLMCPPKSLSCSAVPGPPSGFELLKSLLVKFPTPEIRLLVICQAMWNDLCSNVPAPGIRKISFY